MALTTSPMACDRLVPPDAAACCRVFCVREMQATISTADAGTQCSLRFVSSAGSQTDADFSDAAGHVSSQCLPSSPDGARSKAERGRHPSCPPYSGISGAQVERQHSCQPQTPVASHPEGRPLACVFCLKVFYLREDLLLHIRAHAGVDPYACRHCPAAFAGKEELARHQRTHTGFACGECHKSFRDRSHLARHERLHTGSKPFACSVCPKTFARKEHVRVHERQHSDDTPFVCRFCRKGFKWRTSLLRHERWHASLRPFVCGVCEESFASEAALDSHGSVHSMRYRRTYARRPPSLQAGADSGGNVESSSPSGPGRP